MLKAIGASSRHLGASVVVQPAILCAAGVGPLVTDPTLILVDEPTASLDTTLGPQVVRLLGEEIEKRGKAGIMVTHGSRMAGFTDRTISVLDGVLTPR